MACFLSGLGLVFFSADVSNMASNTTPLGSSVIGQRFPMMGEFTGTCGALRGGASCCLTPLHPSPLHCDIFVCTVRCQTAFLTAQQCPLMLVLWRVLERVEVQSVHFVNGGCDREGATPPVVGVRGRPFQPRLMHFFLP